MSASNLLSQEKPVTDRRAYEPSMEEILASIRRIIADDQAFSGSASVTGETVQLPETSGTENIAKPVKVAPAATPKVKPAAVAPLAAEIPATSNRTDAETGATTQSRPVAAVKTPEPVREVKAPSASAAQTAAHPVQYVTKPSPEAEFGPVAPARKPTEPQSEMMSEDGEPGLALKGSFETSEAPADEPLVSQSTDQAVANAFNALIASRFVQTSETMNDMVREMIRPMLKVWLDDNLPIMVERLVRAEIERVARGAR
jgi:uncharacterized protein